MDDTKWVSRLGDLSGVDYVSPPGMNRRKLPQHDAKPRVETFSCSKKNETTLTWKTAEGETSQSPASAWFIADDPRKVSTADLVQRLFEALELPGVASDYHFALLRAYDILWSRRRREPEVLPELERLCLLDIHLVEQRPDIIHMTVQDEELTARVPAFHYLVFLYEQEGATSDALDIARRAAAAGQGSSELDRLQLRVAALEEEDRP